MSSKNKAAAKKARKAEREARKGAFEERYGPMVKVKRRDNNKYPKLPDPS